MQMRKINREKGYLLVRKIGELEKSGVKLQCSTEEGKQPFGSSYREVRKNEGSTVCENDYFLGVILSCLVWRSAVGKHYILCPVL